jgi:hypothetical protein
MLPNYSINILALPDERLEAFVKDWLSSKEKAYVETQRWNGPGDRGRDVVGYLTPYRHEGPWHNYQCKQLQVKLTVPATFLELGKIFMHSSAGAYSLPTRYVFVAPKGVVRGVKDLIAHPEKFRQNAIDTWDEYCRDRLVENTPVLLSSDIKAQILAFDFTQVLALDAAQLADDPHIKPALVKWWKHDPGAAPAGQTPDELQDEEASYLRQLIEAYGERAGTPFSDVAAALADGRWGDHLRTQRTRYFDAAAFKRYYRDNTPDECLVSFEDDIYHGVVDVHADDHPDTLARMIKVLAHASTVRPSGILADYGKSSVKQGLCHHFANEGRLPWRR